LRLTRGGCRCAGILEVMWKGRWSRVCQDSVSKAGMASICQHLGCGPPSTEPLQLISSGGKEPRMQLLMCHRVVANPVGCHWVPANCTGHAVLACTEPAKTTPEPTPTPPVTTPEPTGPDTLLLVEGDSRCSGFVELHKQGLWGAVANSLAMGLELATRICRAVHCGTAIDGHGYTRPQWGSHLPVQWEVVESCENHPLLECFYRTSARRRETPAFIICSGSQPLWRLANGPTPCEGDIEVFHKGRWQVLCDNQAQRVKWGTQLCQQLWCGNLSSSTEIQDASSGGVTCKLPASGPAWAQGSLPVTPVLSPGQDSKPHPTGVAAGTIVSICLALLLFSILVLICGPPAYRRLMKRISKKKQRQWIGPTGLNQTVSFHRNSTITPRSRAEGQRAQDGNNDYTQPPPRSSHLSAYP
ncbi:CD5 protein, partial [Crotophaga sulcirostris]|nr:CD5 protein [Crotophaga sulcirostris]